MINELYNGVPNIRGTVKRKKGPDIISLSKRKIGECKCEELFLKYPILKYSMIEGHIYVSSGYLNAVGYEIFGKHVPLEIA